MQDLTHLVNQDAVSFGPFRLVAGERLLTRGGVPVELGARALDLLILLVSRPQEVIGKSDLLAGVWPDVTVEEGSLRFHVAGLRKALGDGKDGARYIATLPGRGYSFVATVSPERARPACPAAAAPFRGATFLSAPLARMVGREEVVAELSAEFATARFVTITGSGGVGKTTVAIAVANELLPAFDGAVLFFDLGMLSDPKMVPAALASMLGISVQSDDATPSLISYLRDRRFLLVLDNCEHLIQACACLVSQLFQQTAGVHFLATSREALRVEGERVHRLAPLRVPAEEPGLTAATAATFPAVQLFVERAKASGAALDICDENAAVVAHICRKLDGLALAIELAAGRVESFGLQQTAALLDERLALLWIGQRTAPPRQQTLQATLDWSHGLLNEPERLVLRRLAVFVGHFTLEAARAVAIGDAIDEFVLLRAIDSLVAKSMVAAFPMGSTMRYRLLETTRAYVLGKPIAPTEAAALSARHARHFRRWLEEVGADWPNRSDKVGRALGLADLNNVRAALEWCFGEGGEAELGVALAAAATPVFLANFLLTECHGWSERALLALHQEARGEREEMRLQATLGLSSMFTRGSSEAARDALNRSLGLAEELGEARQQLQVLGMLHMFHHRVGDPRSALHHARRGFVVAETMSDPAALTMAHSLLGMSLYLTGDLRGARKELEAALRHGSGPRANANFLGFDGQVLAGCALARTLWTQGHPDQALDRARRSVEEAMRTDHPVALSIALMWVISVLLGVGDLQSAEEHIDLFIARAETYSLVPYVSAGRGLKGEVALRRGDEPERVIEILQRALEELHVARYRIVTTAFSISLSRALAGAGRTTEAIRLIDDTIELIHANGEFCYMPEALRVKAGLHLAKPRREEAEAEDLLLQSLDWSRRQAAPAWELRSATDLAALWTAQGRIGEARALLQPVFERFSEGFDTRDVQNAARVLRSFGPSDSRAGRSTGSRPS